MVTGKAQLAIIFQQAGKSVQIGLNHHSAAMMAGFWPGVGKQHKYTAKARRRQGIHQDARVIIINTHIFEPRPVDMGQQAGNTIDKRLTANKPDVRMVRRLGSEMLTRPETDFQP